MRTVFCAFLILISNLFLHAQELKTGISVHDPVIMRQNGIYHIFCTGTGITEWSSTDRLHWKKESPVFTQAPAWVMADLPAFDNLIWAPDISYYQGHYYLFYAVSAFGKNTSSIGLATNTTLDHSDRAYKWIDQGKIIQSHPGIDNWNAIDPNLITDIDGTPYLAFGSFWSGLKLVKLSADRKHIDQSLVNLPSIASRQGPGTPNLPAVDGNPVNAGGNAIEAPFIYRRGNYFYLFASINYCCKGPLSTYKMIVGRSATLKGPYLDMQGKDMSTGGGSLLLAGDSHWYGVGHNAVCNFDSTDYLIFHGYDAADGGHSKLRIEKLTWPGEWPLVDSINADQKHSMPVTGSEKPAALATGLLSAQKPAVQATGLLSEQKPVVQITGLLAEQKPAALAAGLLAEQKPDTLIHTIGNPIITHKFTADPAAMVYKDQVYLYTGHDEAPKNQTGYVMHDWCCFSSPDLVNWTEHRSSLNIKAFSWAKADAWASQVIERNGKFYWYVAVEHATIPGKAIGVAVADSPTGPFTDARGTALITNDMTKVATHPWDDIDPTVMIDDDGQAWLFWGNGICYYAKLKADMIELEGEIYSVKLPHYTEAPWIHKHHGWYYLSYAAGFPEKIAYAMSRSIQGPWVYKGIINEIAGNSNTNHQAIIDFNEKSYFIYHNGALAADAGSFHRSVCIDYLYYNSDGSIKPVIMTSDGVKSAIDTTIRP